jgi:hypothetical protein
MSESKPLLFQKVWDNIHEAYNRLATQPISATHLPRSNYSDACKVLSGISLLDIITDVNVELKTNKEDVVIIFSKDVEE